MKSVKIDFTATNLANIDEPFGRLDSPEKKDSVRTNFWKLGRNINYRQSGSVGYNVPFNKLPLTDWINLNLRYLFDYSWLSGPLGSSLAGQPIGVDPSVGSTIQNSNTKQLNSTFNLTTLYRKSKAIKQMLGPKPPKPKPKPKEQQIKPAANDSVKVKKEKKEIIYGPVSRTIAAIVFSLKNVSLNYSETNGTLLNGFNRTPELFGNNIYQNESGSNIVAPGMGFVFGSQADIRAKAAQNRWLITDTLFTTVFTQTHVENFNARGTIEPIRGMRLELNMNRNYTRNINENYRATVEGGYNGFSHVENGNFSISWNSIATSFTKDRKDYSSVLYDKFIEYRKIISLRLGEGDPLSISLDSAGFADGYGANQQEVLTYSFLAAYTGKSAGGIKLNPFPTIPKINWRFSYDGLSRLSFAKNLFSSVNLTHAYRSTYSVGSYTTNVLYKQDGSARDLSNNFIPKEEFGMLTINEQFSPLIGIDINWKNNKLTTRFEYKRDRNLSLSYADIQITEVKGQEFTIGAGYRWRNFKMPFGLSNPRSNNDLNLTADISYRRNSTIIRRLLEGLIQPTAGITVISLKFAADYILNERLNIRFFFDRVINTPLISNAFPTANTQAGISIRFTLAQ
jgi:cell surface protein SprA